jgi:hypothetical protein
MVVWPCGMKYQTLEKAVSAFISGKSLFDLPFQC